LFPSDCHPFRAIPALSAALHQKFQSFNHVRGCPTMVLINLQIHPWSALVTAARSAAFVFSVH
jgi:hypothetical protein